MEDLCRKDVLTTFMKKMNKPSGVICMAFAPVVVIVNSLLIASFIATKQSMKNTSNFLIVCLSISDCLSGAILMPINGIQFFWWESAFCRLKIAVLFFSTLFSGISMTLTMLIAVDRYLHMNPDFNRESSFFAKLFKKPRIYVVVFITIAIFIALSGAQFLLGNLDFRGSAYYNLVYTVLFLITISALIVVYTRGYWRIRRFVAENPIYAERAGARPADAPEYLQKLYKTVLLILIAMLLALLPVSVSYFSIAVYVFAKRSFQLPKELYLFCLVSVFVYYTNAVTNALIIFYRNDKSKKWLMTVVRGLCQKQSIEAEVQNNAAITFNQRRADVENTLPVSPA